MATLCAKLAGKRQACDEEKGQGGEDLFEDRGQENILRHLQVPGELRWDKATHEAGHRRMVDRNIGSASDTELKVRSSSLLMVCLRQSVGITAHVRKRL